MEQYTKWLRDRIKLYSYLTKLLWLVLVKDELTMAKITALLRSRRFWLAVAGVAAVALGETIGLDEQKTLEIAGIIIAWVLGDSIRETK